MGILKKILPIAAGAVGNYFLPGIGGQVAAGLTSSLIGGKSTRDSAKQSLVDQLRAYRPNQTNASGASSTWTEGPNGQWSQTQKFGSEEQARRDLFNQIAMQRMQSAGSVNLGDRSKPIDYKAFQLQHSPLSGMGGSMGGNFIDPVQMQGMGRMPNMGQPPGARQIPVGAQ